MWDDGATTDEAGSGAATASSVAARSEEQMTDVPTPRSGVPPALNELPLEDERYAALMPKLAAILNQFGQLEALERPDVEPAPPMPERWDDDERR
jgi:hypothetical protein